MKEMTSRERIIEAMNHRETELLPIDFGGMRSTGISAIAYNNLKKYLGLKGQPAKVYDVFQQLAEPELEIVDRLGGDVVQAHRLCPAFGIGIKTWIHAKLQAGSECIVPEGYAPVRNELGDLEIRNGETVIAKMPQNGYYFDQVHHPYERVETEYDIYRIPIPGITEEELEFLETEVKQLYENTDKAILISFGGNILEAGQINWGYEKFFLDMALNPDLVHYWLNKLTDAYLRDLEKFMRVVGKYVHVIQFGDDLGTQEAPQISPAMYREMIKPYHARQYQFIRNNYPNVKVFLHSCGAICDPIPDLIDAGAEVLNPVQIYMNLKKSKNLQQLILLGILLFLCVILSFLSKEFLTVVNITNVLRQQTMVAITAVGATFIMITTGLDISVGSTIALSGVVFAKLVQGGMPIITACVSAVLVGGFVGLLNAAMIVGARINPVIATLGTMYAVRGTAYLVAGGATIANGLPLEFMNLGRGHIGIIPVPVIFMLVVYLVFHFVLSKTLLGKYTYAIGGNIETSRLSGISVKKVLVSLYVITGLLTGLSGTIMASRLNSGNPQIGQGFEFDVIIAVFLGGVSTTGGEGTLVGTFMGAMIVGILSNGLNFWGSMPSINILLRVWSWCWR